jgi:hypothetical protein
MPGKPTGRIPEQPPNAGTTPRCAGCGRLHKEIHVNKHPINESLLAKIKVRLWSGHRAVNRAEFDGQNLPPKELLRGFEKPLLDIKHLRPLGALKKSLDRAFNNISVYCDIAEMSLIPPNRVDDALQIVDEAEAKVARLRNDLVTNLPFLFVEWEDKNPEWRDYLRANRPATREVERAIYLKKTLMPIPVASSSAPGLVSASIDSIQAGVVPQLFIEIAYRASQSLKRSFFDGKQTKEKARSSSLNELRAIEEKLADFVFFDGSVAPVLDQVRATLAGMPTKGPLSPLDIARVVMTLSNLSNPHTIAASAAGVSRALQAIESTDDDDDAVGDEVHMVIAPPAVTRGQSLLI